ncbi:MAG: YitT family protein [Bacilli bacterium]|nr:YitT family protein [Bacilli bacterium]
MVKKKSIQRKVHDFLLDHTALYLTATHGYAFIVTSLSALIFAFGYACFLVPSALIEADSNVIRLISGGISGISQNVIAFITLFEGNFIEVNNCEPLVYGILYFLLNMPLMVLAWFGVGKRFTIYTVINVAEVSLFSFLLSNYASGFIEVVAKFCSDNGGMLSRALFAGVCTGLASALAYKIDASAGGIDVLAYYIALKKSTMVGKYSVLVNSVTISIFTLLTMTKFGWGTEQALHAFASVFYAVLYLIMTMLVTDLINQRNKKVLIETVTSHEDLGKTLIEMVPHAATQISAQGVYSGNDKWIIRIVISSYEVKKTVNLIRSLDDAAFISVTELRQVYGRFFMRPIK